MSSFLSLKFCVLQKKLMTQGSWKTVLPESVMCCVDLLFPHKLFCDSGITSGNKPFSYSNPKQILSVNRLTLETIQSEVMEQVSCFLIWLMIDL